MRLRGRKRRPGVEIEGGAQVRNVRRGDQAAYDALAIISLQPVNLARRARQMFPDGQQQAGHEMDLARPRGRDLAQFLEPCGQ